MSGARDRGRLLSKWDAANQRRADRANTEYRERDEMFRPVETVDGLRIYWALPAVEPVNDFDLFEIVLFLIGGVRKRFCGRTDFKVVVCRERRLGGYKIVYRRDRLTKQEAKEHLADLVASAELEVAD